MRDQDLEEKTNLKNFVRWLTIPALCLLTLALACGPTAQSAPEEAPSAQPVTQDSEATPPPEPTPKYPNLDEALQNLVQRFEDGELSESEAAALAPVHHGSSVLVEVALPTNIDDVDAWMGTQGISSRFADANYIPPHIYAYVKVSLLGALSQQEGVTLVRALIDDEAFFPEFPPESGGTAREDRAPSSTTEPRLPIMKGYPYPKLLNPLQDLVYRYERGDITEAEAAAETGLGQGSSVLVEVTLIPDPANTDTVVAWLEGNGVSPEVVLKGDGYDTRNYVHAYVPVSLLGALSKQTGVIRVVVPIPLPKIPEYLPSDPQDGAQPDIAEPPEPPPAIASQGVAVHGADAWHTAGYRGSGVKVGIIDVGFYGFSGLMGTELPANTTTTTRVKAQCYTSRTDLTPSTDINDCASGATHGTSVAQAVIDMAPEAPLYISNASLELALVGNSAARQRLKNDVKWMIRNGVDVINYSIGWNYFDGFGDGIPRGSNAVLDTVDDAVAGDANNDGIVWVNAAGNEGQRIWYGAFSGGTNNPPFALHEFASGDERNYITLGTGTKITAELHWNDSWGGADCDLDLLLYREAANGSISLAAISNTSQLGGTYDIPYEALFLSNASALARYYLQIRKTSHSSIDSCSNVAWLQFQVTYPHTLEHSTGYNITIPADSRNRGMLAVGAAHWNNRSTIQAYSSRGPTTDGRIKPEIVGADCGKAALSAQVVPGTTTSSSTSNCWFWGTSQAAPHVSGMAALV